MRRDKTTFGIVDAQSVQNADTAEEKGYDAEKKYQELNATSFLSGSGARPQKAVTPGMGKALLISGRNGHMFPAKPWDTWARRQEHALRHIRVQNAALYKNGVFVTRLRRSRWAALPHPPFVVDDTIGRLLESQEGFPPAKARVIRECPLAARDCGGLAGLPASAKAKLLWRVARYGLKLQDGVDLYGKYMANWGGEATTWRFDGLRDGQAAASVTCRPSAKLHLEVKASRTALIAVFTVLMVGALGRRRAGGLRHGVMMGWQAVRGAACQQLNKSSLYR